MAPVSKILASNIKPERLDSVLPRLVDGFSKNAWRRLIEAGMVLVDGEAAKKSDLIKGGTEITLLRKPGQSHEETLPKKTDLGLKPLFADESLVVFDKPPGIPVHPIAPDETRTLVNQFAFLYPEAMGVGDGGLKSGMVNRIDNGTSGIVLFARNEKAWKKLREQFTKHSARKTYIALVKGEAPVKGRIDIPLMHSPKSSKRMIAAGPDDKGLDAHTTYRRILVRDGFSLLMVRIKTGVMHQIRSHLKLEEYPIVGDDIYNPQKKIPAPEWIINYMPLRNRYQFLHSMSLVIRHPVTDAAMRIVAKRHT